MQTHPLSDLKATDVTRSLVNLKHGPQRAGDWLTEDGYVRLCKFGLVQDVSRDGQRIFELTPMGHAVLKGFEIGRLY